VSFILFFFLLNVLFVRHPSDYHFSIFNLVLGVLLSPLTSRVRTAHGGVYSIQHYMIKLSVTCGRSVIFDVNKQIHHVGKVFPKGI
jgi:drug/metabolite transporter superfamily protein YnfA